MWFMCYPLFIQCSMRPHLSFSFSSIADRSLSHHQTREIQREERRKKAEWRRRAEQVLFGAAVDPHISELTLKVRHGLLTIFLFLFLSVALCVSFYSLCLFLCLFLSPSLFISLTLCLSLSFSTLYLSLFVSLTLCLSLSVCVSLFVSLTLCVSRCVFLFFSQKISRFYLLLVGILSTHQPIPIDGYRLVAAWRA